MADRVGGVSRSAVQKVADDENIHRCVPLVKPPLSETNVAKRLAWANDNVDTDWRRVAYTDETTLVLGKPIGRPLVSRKPGEEFLPQFIKPRYNSGRKSCMFWAAISYHTKSPLILLQWPSTRTTTLKSGKTKTKKAGFSNEEYAAQVLSKALPEFLEDLSHYSDQDYTVVEDGCRVHNGPFVRAARRKYPFTNQTHPPYSPDLNPIENLWGILKKEIWKISGAHKSLSNLIKAAQKAWDAIPQEVVQNLIDSMPTRRDAILEANGGHTKY